MADTVYTVETISLQDEDSTEVVLKPLVISAMKRFMKKREQLMEINQKKIEEDPASSYELGFDMMVELAGVCLEKQLKQERTAKQYKEFLEDSLDFDTANYVIEKMTGITFTSSEVDEDTPKAREAGIV